MSKYKEGDKFIIEIGQVGHIYTASDRYYIKGFNTLVFDDNGLDRLEKQDSQYDFFNDYIEEVKRIAYKEGFRVGKQEQNADLYSENGLLKAENKRLLAENKTQISEYETLKIRLNKIYDVNKNLQTRLAKVQEVAKGEDK